MTRTSPFCHPDTFHLSSLLPIINDSASIAVAVSVIPTAAACAGSDNNPFNLSNIGSVLIVVLLLPGGTRSSHFAVPLFFVDFVGQHYESIVARSGFDDISGIASYVLP